jgi:hypothetical protein
MSGLPFAARSTPKIPFGHKIHHQIQFLKEFQPRLHKNRNHGR